jgi:hypothetical protein
MNETTLHAPVAHTAETNELPGQQVVWSQAETRKWF